MDTLAVARESGVSETRDHTSYFEMSFQHGHMCMGFEEMSYVFGKTLDCIVLGDAKFWIA